MRMPTPEEAESRMGSFLLQRKSASYTDYIKRPELKLLLSMLPPASNPDLVTTLARALFEAGFEAGSVATQHYMHQIIEEIRQAKG